MDLFWELHQHRRIARVQSKADRLAHRAGRLDSRIADLEQSIDKLLLIQRAVWELTAEKLALGDGELEAKVQEIDLRDGAEDGKLRVARQCPKCERVVSRKHDRCLYCGAEDLGPDVFDDVK